MPTFIFIHFRHHLLNPITKNEDLAHLYDTLHPLTPLIFESYTIIIRANVS